MMLGCGAFRHCVTSLRLRVMERAALGGSVGRIFCATAIVAGLLAVIPLRAAQAQGGSAEGICATTSDPTSCQQMLNSAISQGTSSQLPSSPGAGGGIQQLLQGLGQGQSPNNVPGMINGPQPSVVVTPETPSARHRLQHSHLEDIYSTRAGTYLSQFGYDVLGNGGSVSALQIGAVQDQYILGQGDEVVVTLRGQENATYNVFVDRDGNVTLPRLRPISASGRRFGDFRQDLDAAIHEGYIQTLDYITIGQVRQISVDVAGEVFSPGVYALSGLSTVLDAIELAGGVNKAGSLRDVTVVRDGHALHFDLYKFLSAEGKTPDTTLRQGDRIVIPPIGATIAVAGEVRRPGIYELEPGASSVTARWLIGIANGYTIRGAYRLTILRTRPDGKLEYVDASSHESIALRDGDVLVVNRAVNYTIGDITLEGNVRLPGDYALNKIRTLHDLLPSSESFLPLTYTPFAFIVRLDKQTLQRKIIPFSVTQLLAGTYNLDLESQDIVHILTFNAMHQLVAISSVPQNAEGVQIPGGPATQEYCQQEESALRDLPRPERASSATALKLPNCPAAAQGSAGVLAGPIPQTNFEQLLASSALGQTPASSLLGAAQSLQKPVGANGNSPAWANPGAAQAAQGGMIAPGTIASGDTGAGAASAGSAISAGGGAGAGSVSAAGVVSVEGLSADETSTLGFVVGDYRVTLDGDVRAPGIYLAAPGATLGELVDAANGLAPDADLDAVEITSVDIDNVAGRSTASRKVYSLTPEKLASVEVHRLDVVQIPHVPSDQEEGDVMIDGQVMFPGTFHILKGEKLSSLLTRAGGLTKLAYPSGAVFQRPSVARLQQTAYSHEADDLQEQLMASVAQGGSVLTSASGQALGLSPEAAGFLEDVITQLRMKTADGRISIVADPVTLAANPQADIELQPGDRLFIPRRPSEVMVTGEVLSPGNYRYTPKLTVADYIGLSGGYNRYADDDHVFVINPDGTAKSVSDDILNFSPTGLAPGSMIVVPRDLKPLDLGALTVTVAKVFSDFALSAASIAVLSHNTN
jgi:polysaccharide biosynthesis/export protein